MFEEKLLAIINSAKVFCKKGPEKRGCFDTAGVAPAEAARGNNSVQTAQNDILPGPIAKKMACRNPSPDSIITESGSGLA